MRRPHSRRRAVGATETYRPSPPTRPQAPRQPHPAQQATARSEPHSRAANARRDTDGTSRQGYSHNAFISQVFPRQRGLIDHPYKGKAVDLKQIGRELNVRYVLEGSVQRGGGRMRVNVQLIDAEIGNHVWAERFEKPLADLLDMQDEIVARLANALNAQLIAAEARRAERAPNPNSMDLYFQGMAWINRGTTPEYVTQARGFFDRALELDPRNVEALVGTASVDVMVSITYMTDDQATRLASAEAALARALSLAPEHALAHLMMGRIHIVTNRVAEGIAECERALALDRNLADAHAVIGLAKIFSGHPEETETHVNEAFRLSPRDHRAYRWIQFVGTAQAPFGPRRGGRRVFAALH